MRKMKVLDWIAMVLLIVGGLNWGLIGLFDADVLATIFGHMSVLARILYILVGLSGLYMIYVAIASARRP